MRMQGSAELALIRAAGIKVFSVGLSSSASSQVVSSLVVPPPPILNWNYFLSSSISQQLLTYASPVSNQASVGRLPAMSSWPDERSVSRRSHSLRQLKQADEWRSKKMPSVYQNQLQSP
jgi:hypothetical protein